MNFKIWIPAILVIISTSYTAQYHYGVFNYYNYFSAQKDLKKGSVQLLLYGHLEEDENELIHTVEEDLGVTVKRVAGEDITPDKRNGFKKYNSVMLHHLAKLHGEQFLKQLQLPFELEE